MELAKLKNVMKKYGVAWEKQDSDLILKCFTKTGTYQEGPFTAHYKGHKQIKKFWEKEVVKNTSDVKFSLGKCHITKDTGFAEWTCVNKYKGKIHRMSGIMILKMKGDKISSLNEYWITNS